MLGDTCIVCDNTWAKDPSVSLHHFPKEKQRGKIKALQLKDNDIGSQDQVCSKHFPEGDAKSHDPRLNLRKRFASPKKRWEHMGGSSKHVWWGTTSTILQIHHKHLHLPLMVKGLKKHPLLVAGVVEQLDTDYQLYELPTDDINIQWCTLFSFLSCLHSGWQTTIVLRQKTNIWSKGVKDVKKDFLSWRCGLKWWPTLDSEHTVSFLAFY